MEAAMDVLEQLHVFDTWAQWWIEPSTTGKPPAPRSGHAGCVIGKHWYIAGGEITQPRDRRRTGSRCTRSRARPPSLEVHR